MIPFPTSSSKRIILDGNGSWYFYDLRTVFIYRSTFPVWCRYLVLLLIFQSGCRSTRVPASSQSQPAIQAEDVSVDPQATAPKKPDFLINGATLKGERLEVYVAYSGGCETHSFVLSTTGEVQKSLPPKTPLYLVNTGPPDACREFITDTLYFNMAKVLQNKPKALTFVLNSELEIPTNP